MGNFILTQKAVEDLTNIWNYTFDNWSEKQADTYYYALIENCKLIASNQFLGKEYSIIEEGLLGLRVNSHIIFYRIISSNEIEVTRILHGRMDLKNQIS